jgi:proteasome accessory factor C
MPKQEIDAAELFDISLSIVGVVLNEGDQTLKELSARFDVNETVIKKAVHIITDSEDLRECQTHFHEIFDDDDEGWVSFRRENTSLQGPPLLSKRQLSSIAIGLDYLASLEQFAGNEHLADLRLKLRSSDIVTTNSVVATRMSELLETIQTAVNKSVTIECKYRNQRGDTTQRKIDPLLIELRGRKHYLRGWCHINQEVRSFRLDRIRKISLTESPIPDSSKQAAIPEEVFGTWIEEQVVTLSTEPEASEIFWNFPLAEEPVLKNGRYVGKIRVGGLDGLPRHVVRYGGMVEVLQPREARRLVVEFARAALGEAGSPLDED